MLQSRWPLQGSEKQVVGARLRPSATLSLAHIILRKGAQWWRRTVLLSAVLALVCIPVQAAELTWQAAVTLALQKHPTMVAALRAQDSAVRALQKVEAGLLPQVTLGSKPVARGFNKDDKDYSRGSISLTTAVTTPKSLSGSAAITRHWGDDDAVALSFSVNAGLDPESLFYSPTQLNLISARNNTLKADWDLAAQKRSVALNTLATFWRLELDAERLALAIERAKAAATDYELALKRKQLGSIDDTQLLAVQIEKLQSEIALQKIKAEYQARQTALAIDLGLTSLPPLVPTGGVRSNDLVSSYDAATLEQAARDNSLAANKRRLDMALDTFELKQAQASLYPNISLGAAYALTDISNTDNKINRPWSISLSVELPLIDGGRQRMTLQERQSDLSYTASTLERELEAAVTAVRNKLTEWQNARKAVELAKLRLDQARFEENVKARLHTSGLANDKDLTMARWQTRQVEIDLQAALNEQRVIELSIADITGNELRYANQALILER